ncbi:MAG: hypothetical protein AB8H80_01310 [Planctomycetota bacterium]
MQRTLRDAFLLAVSLAASAAAQASASAPSRAAAHHDASLSVLLVGQDPAKPQTGMADDSAPRALPLLRERTAAWESLLRYHFANVTVVHGEDYVVSMSNDADVTIFDVQPKALTPAVRGTDPVTGDPTYQAATFLPQSFDRAAITIAHNSPRIGEPLGLKLDWL